MRDKDKTKEQLIEELTMLRQESETARQDSVQQLKLAYDQAIIYAQELKIEVIERKRAEESLRESVQQLKMAYDQATIYAQELKKEIVERKQAEEELRRRNRELVLLNRVIAATAKELEPEAILDMTCNELVLTFDVSQAIAILLDEERTMGTVVAGFQSSQQPSIPNQTFPISDRAIQYLLNHKKPLILTDLQIQDSSDSAGQAPLQPSKAGGSNEIAFLLDMCVPLIIEGEVIGLIGLADSKAREFSTEEISLATSVAGQVTGALERARLNKERRQLSAAIEQTAEGVVITDTDGNILYVNPAFERITSYARAEVVGENINILKSDKHDPELYKALWTTVSTGQVWQGQLINRKKDGTFFTAEATINPVRDTSGEIVNYVSVQRDVTRELELEEQYRQAQKMQAVGLLAGGIAHDFNNLLTVMNGFAEMIQFELPPEALELQNLASGIRYSGKRAAALVNQLLAFSRKQIVEPKVLNINAVVTNIGTMLDRLIHENVVLEISLGPELWSVKVDPTQIEQIIVNLAVNARDAMPSGGRLLIETANAPLDDEDAAKHLGLEPGEYVLLAVSDTGIGMSEEIKAHIFEPFFTTKEPGKGSGLGLATVFGIVEQNGGHIWLYSEAGQGTVFKVYLPRVQGEVALPTRPSHTRVLPRGNETILVVEDETAVRDLATYVLRRQGYTVLKAANGREALHVTQEHPGEIHLLLTDTVMPQMGGAALANEFKVLRPNSKVLFTSGHTDKTLTSDGTLNPDINFIPKPFSARELASKVRTVLDSES